MCIIVYKPEEEVMPEEKVLRTCFRNNPDGSGFMYRNNDHIVIKKGFMKFDDFYSALTKIPDVVNKDVVMHFRIATHGTVCPENTHPFPVTRNINSLRKLDARVRYAIAHNGIISGYDATKNKHNLSDTMMFVKTLEHAMNDTNAVKETLRVTYGRFILLTPTSTILSGEWVFNNGIMFSNSSYEERIYTQYYDKYYKSTKPTKYQHLLDDFDADCIDKYTEDMVDKIEEEEQADILNAFYQLGEWGE